MEYYSVIKKNEMMPFAATWKDLEMIILSEVSQRKTNIISYRLSVESKLWHKWTYLWNRNRLTGTENRLVVAKGGEVVERRIGSLGLVDANYYIEWINNKVLLYSTGNYIQYPVINHSGKEKEKEYIEIDR